ncbi:unnamed protein product [Musa hybrid cultivar]
MVIGCKSTVQLPYLRVSGESSDRFPRPRNSVEPTPHRWATLVSVETGPCSVPSLRREIFLSRGTQNDFKPQALKCAVSGSIGAYSSIGSPRPTSYHKKWRPLSDLVASVHEAAAALARSPTRAPSRKVCIVSSMIRLKFMSLFPLYGLC